MQRTSKKRLLRDLMLLLRRTDIQLVQRKLSGEHGQVWYERRKDTGELYDIRIQIDPRNAKVASVVIHELLHLYFAINHRFDLTFVPDLEEVMVKGLEDELTDSLESPGNLKLLETWLHEIDRKLADGKKRKPCPAKPESATSTSSTTTPPQTAKSPGARETSPTSSSEAASAGVNRSHSESV